MKKLFVSILALAAFAACQSDFDDVTMNTPGLDDQVVPEGMVRIYAEVGVGEEDTKATYGDGLKAMWEDDDKIAILQESANYNVPFSTVNELKITSGAGTSKAAFNGDITVPTESPRRYHIAYPADAVSFNTSSTLTKTSESTYAYREDGLEVGHYYATASFDYTYNSTLNITVPTKQNGKWEPYMYASTEEAVNPNAIGAKTLSTLTGAIAVRAYKPNADGTKTPLQLKAIAVTATKPIAGVFSGTAKSVGSLGSITGAETSDVYSTVSEGNVLGIWKGAKYGREEAEKLLLAKAQSMTPASITPTSTLSLSFAGSEYTVGAEDTEWVTADNDGNFTYYLNVAPFENADLTIMATAVDGSTLIRTIDKSWSLEAGHRAGFIFTWEDATLKGATIETWYHNWNTDSQFGVLEGGTIYVDNVSVDGNISAEQVLSIGVKINGTFHEASAQSEVLSISPIVISGLESGVYKVQPVAKVSLNGEEKWLECAEVEKTVTSIPQVIDYSVRTSYSSNGTEAKTNDIDGRLLKVTASLSDNYFVDNGLATIEVYNYNDNNKLGNIVNGEYSNTKAALGQYSCYVKIKFTNNYEIITEGYTTHVTGIPYYADWRSADYSDWIYSNVSDDGSRLSYKKSSNAYIVSPAFHFPTSLSINSQVAATTNGTSTSDANKMYVSTGNRSSTYSKSGTTVTMDYKASPSGGSDYDYIDCGNFTMSSSSPCLVYSHKNFFTCTTYLFRLKIVYVL